MKNISERSIINENTTITTTKVQSQENNTYTQTALVNNLKAGELETGLVRERGNILVR